MGIRGWVYVITNEAMPGLVKIGYSTKDPALRAQELDHTGSPTPYSVAFDVLVLEPREVERAVHLALGDKNFGKEWFQCSIEHAVQVIRRTAGASIIMENAELSGKLKRPPRAPKFANPRDGRFLPTKVIDGAIWHVHSPRKSQGVPVGGIRDPDRPAHLCRWCDHYVERVEGNVVKCNHCGRTDTRD